MRRETQYLYKLSYPTYLSPKLKASIALPGDTVSIKGQPSYKITQVRRSPIPGEQPVADLKPKETALDSTHL